MQQKALGELGIGKRLDRAAPSLSARRASLTKGISRWSSSFSRLRERGVTPTTFARGFGLVQSR